MSIGQSKASTNLRRLRASAHGHVNERKRLANISHDKAEEEAAQDADDESCSCGNDASSLGVSPRTVRANFPNGNQARAFKALHQ